MAKVPVMVEKAVKVVKAVEMEAKVVKVEV